MSPEQRNLMRQRENMRRQIMTHDADAAVRDSGLQLNPQERARFESRYIQERRKVEQSLRQQVETERQKEIPALIQQLRKEFQIDSRAKALCPNLRLRQSKEDRPPGRARLAPQPKFPLKKN